MSVRPCVVGGDLCSAPFPAPGPGRPLSGSAHPALLLSQEEMASDFVLLPLVLPHPRAAHRLSLLGRCPGAVLGTADESEAILTLLDRMRSSVSLNGGE